MASIFLSEFDKPVRVARSSESAQPWQAIKIYVGGGDISLSREEAAQLAADLLNIAGVTPVDTDPDHAAMLRDSVKQVSA